ncbi:hypothetical protein D3C86_1816560 [compost metagenome]
MYPVTIGLRQGQRLEHQGNGPLTRHITVGFDTKAVAPSAGAKETSRRQQLELARVRHDVDRTDQGLGAFATAQTVDRQMQGGQRPRTHGIDTQARALEVKGVRNAVGDRGK